MNNGAGECRRDQRRLQARTLPVNCVRVRDKVVGVCEIVFGVLEAMEGRHDGRLNFGLKSTVCSFGICFGESECRRDQRRLEARTLPVTCTRVGDKMVGGDWDGVWGPGWRGEGEVGWFV